MYGIEIMKLLLTSDKVTVDLVRSVLEDMGISAHVKSDDTGGLYPSLGFVEGVKIFVPEDRFEEAHKVLDDLLDQTEDMIDANPEASGELEYSEDGDHRVVVDDAGQESVSSKPKRNYDWLIAAAVGILVMGVISKMCR